MKKLLVLLSFILMIVGCNNLLSVGDNNTNTFNENKQIGELK
ncbi:hypothetical protein [Campylobacter sp. MG1]|nr:hypothetical protein [Campylobacter sp. MG1]